MTWHKAEPIGPEAFEQRVLAEGQATLVCFLEDWSEPCKEMDETVDRLTQALYGKVAVCRMGLEDAPLVAARYGVSSIPALVLFVGGEPVQKLFGMRGLEDIVRTVAKHIGDGPGAGACETEELKERGR